jgi:hypothetical protein
MKTMSIYQTAKTNSKKKFWTGSIIRGLFILFLLFDSIMKIVMHPLSVQGTNQLGWATNAVQPLGIVLLFCTIMYLIPRTAIFGTILLTGYMGGAIATMMRIGTPFYFPLFFVILLWCGLFLRDKRLQVLIS